MARTKPPARDIVHGDVSSGARFDSTGAYRYHLWRRWAEGPSVCFIMLNPSTADATRDDPTVRRCVSFAQAHGFGALEVVNRFAYRTTNPRMLAAVDDPYGPGNDEHVRAAMSRADAVVAAWGNAVKRLPRLECQSDLLCLGLNMDGTPVHPGRISNAARFIPFVWG